MNKPLDDAIRGSANSPTPDASAADLMPLVYDQLRVLARSRLAEEGHGHTLQATALVNEAYLRLVKSDSRFSNRAHFFWLAAETMRRILIEHARGKKRLKRGGRMRRAPIDVLDLAAENDPGEILAFDDAIRRLEQQMPQAASVVRLRFYAGLSIDETAETLGVSPRTVNREWTFARAWLFRELEHDGMSGARLEK